MRFTVLYAVQRGFINEFSQIHFRLDRNFILLLFLEVNPVNTPEKIMLKYSLGNAQSKLYVLYDETACEFL